MNVREIVTECTGVSCTLRDIYEILELYIYSSSVAGCCDRLHFNHVIYMSKHCTVQQLSRGGFDGTKEAACKKDLTSAQLNL